MTRRISVDGAARLTRHRESIGSVLQQGGVIAFPTEGPYGVGCDPRNSEAVARLVALKGRAPDKPLPLIATSADAARAAVRLTEPAAVELWELLARRYWPGALTLVAPVSSSLADAVAAGTGTIGVRVSGLPLARDLADLCGGLIVATSANRSGEGNPATAGDVERSLGEGVDLVLDAGPAPAAVPSTVLAIAGGRARGIRWGALPRQDLAAVLGPALEAE